MFARLLAVVLLASTAAASFAQSQTGGATTLQVTLNNSFSTGKLVEKMMSLLLKGNGQTVFAGELEVQPK